jgi:6-phosphofructokinase
MKIAMLTGGGDCPGLNSALKGLALGALEQGWEVVGIRKGWLGLLQLDPDDPASCAQWTVPLDAEAVRTIDRFGGTFLHSSRTNPAAVKTADLPAALRTQLEASKASGKASADPSGKASADPSGKASAEPSGSAKHDCTAHVLRNLEKLGVTVLFPIGGDDTLSFGERLYKEGFHVIGIPKTMDNDVHGTDYCLGFATAVSRSVEYLHNLRSCTASHERFCVVECMGRNAGYTSLIPAYLASVDRALISEVPFDIHHLADLLLRDRAANPSRYAMVTVSEGAHMLGEKVVQSGEADAYGHQKLGGIGQQTADALKDLTKEGVVFQNLGYLVRCGRPDPLDVMVTFNFANLAIELAKANKFGNLVRLHRGVYGHAPMSVLSEGKKTVDLAKYYDEKNYRAKISSVLGLPMYLN